MPIHPGDMLAGYRVVRLLGRGGMGEVWSARDEEGSCEVAIKVLLPRAALKPDLVRRFEREAQVASAIDSPYVCRLLALERDDSGALLLVFEKLDGESLAERLKRELYLPFAEVGPLMDDVFEGLLAAHAAGVIHRDLKPGNIYMQQVDEPDCFERAKILDFGISKIAKSSGVSDEPSLTDFDATLGSFAYMAPEQVRGAARVNESADLYAAGAVAFRALAGRLPFEAATAGMLIALKVDRPAPTLSEVTGDQWPAGLERFLARLLQRDREQRHGSASEALEEWRQIQPEAISRRSRPADVGDYVTSTTDNTAPDTAVDGDPTMSEFSFPSEEWDETRVEDDDLDAPTEATDERSGTGR